MQVEQKQDIIHDDIEKAQSHGDEYEGGQLKGLETERVELTEEDVSHANKHQRRQTDIPQGPKDSTKDR